MKLERQEYSEDYWGTLSYISDKGEDITMKIPVEQGDYGMVYDNIYEVLEHGAGKAIKDDDVIKVLELIEMGIRIAREAGK